MLTNMDIISSIITIISIVTAYHININCALFYQFFCTQDILQNVLWKSTYIVGKFHLYFLINICIYNLFKHLKIINILCKYLYVKVYVCSVIVNTIILTSGIFQYGVFYIIINNKYNMNFIIGFVINK